MAKFIKSAATAADWINDNTIEVVFIGRSNVGKSSLINALAHQKIAITSKTPGRTQLANFYDFGPFRLIDLPGYGFAKVHKAQQVNLINIIDEVLMTRKNVYAVFQIVDANVITSEDISMNKYLDTKFVNHFVILNKADKQSLKTYMSQKQKIANYLQISSDKMLFVSAKKTQNINGLMTLIKGTVNQVK